MRRTKPSMRARPILQPRMQMSPSQTPNVQSSKANVERLTQMKGFERVVALFEGVITARNVEQGDLVNDGSGNGTRSLFSIAQSSVLRVQIEVPQSAALDIKQGAAGHSYRAGKARPPLHRNRNTRCRIR